LAPQTIQKSGLDRSDLAHVFVVTAVASAVITAGTAPIDLLWSLRYGLMAALALLNWIALAKILQGVTGDRKGIDLLVGVTLKPLLLVFLLIYAMHFGIEATSFLLALNTFFICLFLYMEWQKYTGRSASAARVLTPAKPEANG